MSKKYICHKFLVCEWVEKCQYSKPHEEPPDWDIVSSQGRASPDRILFTPVRVKMYEQYNGYGSVGIVSPIESIVQDYRGLLIACFNGRFFLTELDGEDK